MDCIIFMLSPKLRRNVAFFQADRSSAVLQSRQDTVNKCINIITTITLQQMKKT